MGILNITPDNYTLELKDMASNIDVHVWIGPIEHNSMELYRIGQQKSEDAKNEIIQAIGKYKGYEIPAIEIRSILRKIFGRRFSVRRDRYVYSYTDMKLAAHYNIASKNDRQFYAFVTPEDPRFECRSIRITINYNENPPYPCYKF